jgi:hypothetical protein
MSQRRALALRHYGPDMDILAVGISAVALVLSPCDVWHSTRSTDASDRSANASEPVRGPP